LSGVPNRTSYELRLPAELGSLISLPLQRPANGWARARFRIG
jgi:hypothetical protein